MHIPHVALISGDGIGPEVVDAAVSVADAALARDSARVEWTRFEWSTNYYLQHGQMMPTDGLQQLHAFDAILLGAVGDPRVPDTVTLHELIFPIRRVFEQYLNLRPAYLYKGVESPLRGVEAGDIDMIIVRENTEGEYPHVGGPQRANRPTAAPGTAAARRPAWRRPARRFA